MRNSPLLSRPSAANAVAALLLAMLLAFAASGLYDTWDSQRRQYADYRANLRPVKKAIRQCLRAHRLDPDLCGHAAEFREVVDWVNRTFDVRARPVIDAPDPLLRRKLRLYTHTAYRERDTACRVYVQKGIVATHVPGFALVRINSIAVLAVPAANPLAVSLEEAARRCTPARS